MWSARKKALAGGLWFAIDRESRPASFEEVIEACQCDSDSLLSRVQFAAFRWETPAVTAATVSRPFEFVVLHSHGLARKPDPEAFAKYFRETSAQVATFSNLGGDAILVAPCPITDQSIYGHLASFVRLAPRDQRHALWQAVGAAMAQRLSPQPVWLNTAGAGVPWLHVRLDDRPKYYAFAAYRSPS